MFFGSGIPAVNWCLCSAPPHSASVAVPALHALLSVTRCWVPSAGRKNGPNLIPKGASELAIHRIWDWLRKKSWWPWSKATYKRLGYVRYLQSRFLKWPLVWLRKWMEDDFRWNLDECFDDLWSKGTRQFFGNCLLNLEPKLPVNLKDSSRICIVEMVIAAIAVLS